MKALILLLLLAGCAMSDNQVIRKIDFCKSHGFGYTVLRHPTAHFVVSVECDYEGVKNDR